MAVHWNIKKKVRVFFCIGACLIIRSASFAVFSMFISPLAWLKGHFFSHFCRFYLFICSKRWIRCQKPLKGWQKSTPLYLLDIVYLYMYVCLRTCAFSSNIMLYWNRRTAHNDGGRWPRILRILQVYYKNGFLPLFAVNHWCIGV